MKIGILSDTHGNLPATAKAARIFLAAGVGAVLHCGDIGGVGVLAELAAVFHPLGIPVFAVFGNVDAHSKDWTFFPSGTGVELLGRFGELDLNGHKIALLHSDDRTRFHKAVFSSTYDFVFFGHSHEVHDHTIGTTRCINPGTAGRGDPNTCAILDLASGALSIENC